MRFFAVLLVFVLCSSAFAHSEVFEGGDGCGKEFNLAGVSEVSISVESGILAVWFEDSAGNPVGATTLYSGSIPFRQKPPETSLCMHIESLDLDTRANIVRSTVGTGNCFEPKLSLWVIST